MADTRQQIDCQWLGAKMITGGKGYVSAPLGQLHYRDIGPHDSPVTVLLFHQSPHCLIEFGNIQNNFASRGIRVIVPDTPGYGMSDHPECAPTIGELADNMLALLDAKQLSRVVVGGHHTGACISAAFAARHPERVAGVILHGCPLYTDEEAAAFRSRPEWPRTPVIDGSHLSQLFKWPGVKDAAELATRTWMSASMIFQGPDIGHWAVNRYDMASDLKRIRVPGLIIAEAEDVTFHMDQRVRALKPDFMYRVISEKGTSAAMFEPEKWCDVGMEFFLENGLTSVRRANRRSHPPRPGA